MTFDFQVRLVGGDIPTARGGGNGIDSAELVSSVPDSGGGTHLLSHPLSLLLIFGKSSDFAMHDSHF